MREDRQTDRHIYTDSLITIFCTSPEGKVINNIIIVCNLSKFCRMQVYAKHTKQESRGLSRKKAILRKNLRKCVDRKLLREVGPVNDDDNDPYFIYEFGEKLTGRHHAIITDRALAGKLNQPVAFVCPSVCFHSAFKKTDF